MRACVCGAYAAAAAAVVVVCFLSADALLLTDTGGVLSALAAALSLSLSLAALSRRSSSCRPVPRWWWRTHDPRARHESAYQILPRRRYRRMCARTERGITAIYCARQFSAPRSKEKRRRGYHLSGLHTTGQGSHVARSTHSLSSFFSYGSPPLSLSLSLTGRSPHRRSLYRRRLSTLLSSLSPLCRCATLMTVGASARHHYLRRVIRDPADSSPRRSALLAADNACPPSPASSSSLHRAQKWRTSRFQPRNRHGERDAT